MSDIDSSESPVEKQDSVQEEESRFPELDELQREVARRIRDNQRFLEKLESDAFEEQLEEEEEAGGDDEDEIFEEL